MKKARNLWRDLPQGGSRYGSVLTRLFLLLCLLATTQAGWADTEITFFDGTNSSATVPSTLNHQATGFNCTPYNLKTSLQTCSYKLGDTQYAKSIKMGGGASSGPKNLIAFTVPTGYTCDMYMVYLESSTGASIGLGTSIVKPTSSNSSSFIWHTAIAATNTLYDTTQSNLAAGTYYICPSGDAIQVAHLKFTLKETGSTTTVEAPTFSPASGTTVSGSQTITINGPSGSTIYYAWATSAQDAAAIYNSGSGSHGNADAGTATTTVESGKTLYAIARKNDTNSTVASASYTIDGTAPTLSSSIPEDGATDVATSGTIILTFNEAIASVDATKFSLSSGTRDGVAIDGSDNTKVNITYSGMANNTAITLTTVAGAVTDAVGNTSAALDAITFTTASGSATPAAAPSISFRDSGEDYVTTSNNKDYTITDATHNFKVRVVPASNTYVRYDSGTTEPEAPTLTTGTEISGTESSNITFTGTYYIKAVAWDKDKTPASATEVLFTFTPGSTTPTVTFNPTTTTVEVGKTVTNEATLSGATGDITYSSSDTSVADVNSSTGEVTGVAAGTATITATYTENSTDYTDNYTITVTEAATPSAGQTWDFTTTWNKTADEIKASSEWNNDKRNESALANAELTVGGTKIDVTEGLKFTSAAKYVELHPNEYIVLRNNATTFTVPNVAAGSTITISTCGDSGSSGVKATTTNVTKTSGSNSSSPSDFVFSVTTAGDCSFARAQGTNTRIYKITVTSAVTVESPTVTPDTDANFSTNPKSVTFTTNEAGGTTYYVIGASRETNAATIAAANQTASGATNVDVSTFVTSESNAVISAVTKKGDEYSNIVYVDLTYNGTITAKIGNDDNVDIQRGNYATITPIITDAAGKALKFDQDEDATVDYSQYYTFTYAVNKSKPQGQYCSLDATTGKVNTRDASNNKAAIGATITVTVTATPKASPAVTLNYVKDQVLTKDITFTVVKEDETVLTQWVDFYWDEACNIPISENHGGVTGQEKSQKMTFTNFPNGKVIYAKVNKEYADMICFYYNNKDTNEPTAEVSKVNGMTSISNNNGKKYRYRQCLPIYTDANGAGTDGGKVWVTLGGYKENADATVGKFINMEFTIKANSSRPAAPTYTPYTSVSEYDKKASNASEVRNQMTKMTTAKASTANGDPNGTVMAKYSTNNSYTIIELVSLPSDDNPRTLNVGKGSVGVFSTVPTKDTQVRKTTGVQVVDGVISPISNAFYNYYPAQNEVTLKFDPEEVTVHTTGNDAKVFTQPTLNITAKDVSHITPITYSVVSGGEDRIANIDASTGAITFEETPTPGVVVIKAKYAGENYGNDTYAPAEATYTIYMVDPSKEVVLIKPGSRTFTTEQMVVLEGANTWTGYYTTSTKADDVTFDAATWNVIEPGTTTTLHVTETTTVQAMVVDPSDHTAKNRTKQTYTKKTVAPPTLYPDGVTSTYYFTTGELTNGKLAIVAATTEPMANVYYVVDDDPSILTNGGGTRYIGTDKIQIDGSKTTTYVYAVTQDAEGNRSAVVRGVYTKSSNVNQPAFKVNENGTEFASGETKTIAASDKVYIIDLSNETNAVTYYTMDGSSPTTSSMTYSGPFHINKSGTVVKAITVHAGNVSPISTATFNLAAGENRFWEANSSTCDSNGKLKINGGKSGAVINTTTDQTNGVAYITATFGSIYQDSKDVWKHEIIGEESKGEPIDGVGTYQITTGYNPQDENGDLYTHMNSSSSLKVHERTFKLPARGAYVRFEPEKDGDLTIWALQNGGVYYTDATEGQEKFLSGFIRKRPVYMIDEKGICQRATDIKAAGTLSDNWNNIKRDNLLGMNETDSQSGVTQTLYTKADAQAIYDMYNDKIGDASTNNIQDMLVYINDGTHEQAANAGIGTDTETGTEIGVCIPSASYMRYTFKVRAGKTYFFFAQRTKLGIRGFRFDPDVNPATEDVTLDDTGANGNISSSCNTTTDNVTVTNRTFAANTWTALLLPFSISATQVERTFGVNTRVIHFEKYENYKLYWRNHHYDMIVAGTPVLIYPTQEATISGLKVQIESAEANDPTGDSKYTFNGTYNQGTLNKWDIFVANTGVTKQWTGNDEQPYKSLRAWITGFTSTAQARSTIIGIDGNEEDDVTTGIYEIPFEGTDAGDAFAKGNNNVYSVSGMLIRKNATSLEGLPAGVYIINGKKVVIND